MALPYEPDTSPITTDGVTVDPDPPTRDDWDDLEDYTSPPGPAGTIPTTYDGLSLGDLIDFRSHFDTGDLSNGVTVSMRLPEDMARMLDRVLQRDDVPYATKSDFAREGIFVLLKGLVDKLRIHDPMLLSLMAEAKTRAAARFAVDRHEAWKEMRENLEIQLLFWLDRGEPRECGRAISAYWAECQGITYPAWRDHVCQVLRAHPLVKIAALSAITEGFLFPLELRTFAGDWK